MTQTTKVLKHAKGVQYVHLERDFQNNVVPELRMELLLAARNVEMERTVTIMTGHARVVINVALGLRKGRAPQSKIAFVQKKTVKMVITWI